MRNAQLMTCGKRLVSMTKDGLNRHKDTSEFNLTNLIKIPLFFGFVFPATFIFYYYLTLSRL